MSLRNTQRKSFIRSIIILLLGFLLSFPSFTQKTRKQLEQEKKQNLIKIAETQKILKETAREKKATIGQLQAVNNQIKSQRSLIQSMKWKINLLEDEISDIEIVAGGLENDLRNLKEEYANMIYSTHKSNQGFSKLAFLFSASSFNQLYMRFKYLEQYSEARKNQGQVIQLVTDELLSTKTEAETRRDEQSKLLSLQLVENDKLVKLQTRQRRIIIELSFKEAELKTEVDRNRESIARLDKLIADIIAREASGSVKINRTNSAANATFEQMRGRLIWPVKSGFMSSRFGRQPHPVLQGIEVNNSGIRIQTKRGESVAAVSKGTVTRIANIPGLQRVVIVRHGQYLTVYGHLTEVKVAKGQTIARSDIIGTVYTDSEGLSQIEFQIWKGNEKLNPEKWLAKK